MGLDGSGRKGHVIILSGVDKSTVDLGSGLKNVGFPPDKFSVKQQQQLF